MRVAARGEQFAAEPVVNTRMSVDVTIGANEVVERHRTERFYGSVAAVQEAGDAVIGFDSSTTRLVIRQVAVVGDDGKVQHAREDDARLLDRDSYDVLTDGKDFVVQLPSLARGSTSVIEYERVVDRASLPVNWSMSLFPEGRYPLQQLSLRVRWRDDAPPSLFNDVDGLSCERTGAREMVCSGEGFAPIRRDTDVQYRDVMPQVVVSETASWNQVTSKIAEGVEWAVADNAGLDALYARLVDGTTSADERLARLHGFASEAVRYVSLSEGEHDVVPHPVSRTISQRYGDCKDKSALLLALLRKDGRDAWPVLVASDRTDPQRLVHPATHHFDHMVVCMATDEGERCLDPTDAYSSSRHTPSGIQNTVRLDLKRNSVPARVPADRHRWKLDVNTSVEFDATGGQVERTQRSYRDAYAASVRGQLATRSLAERETWLRDAYHAAISNTVEPVFEYGGLESLHSPVTVSSTTRYASLLTPGEATDWTEGANWLTRLTGWMRFENEHYAYRFPGIAVSGEYRFALGSGWTPGRRPAGLKLSSEFGELTRQVRINADTIVVNYRLAMPSAQLPLEKKQAFNAFLDVIDRESDMKFRAAVVAAIQR